MTFGIHVSVTNPEANHFPWRQAIQSYLDFADEVVVVDGCSDDGTAEALKEWAEREPKLSIITLDWPKGVFDYSEFPKHLNAGMAALSTDWKMKVDIDYIFHESFHEQFRKNATYCSKNDFALSYGKLHIINKDHCYFKVNVPFCVRANPSVVYGKEKDQMSGDWAYPIHWDGVSYDHGVPVGRKLKTSESFILGVNLWNYNYFFRTAEETMTYFWRYTQAYNPYHKTGFGDTKEKAFMTFLNIERGRMRKAQFYDIVLEDHPKIMQDSVSKLNQKQYGFNNWGIWDYYHSI